MASKKKRNLIKKGVKVLGKGRVTIEDGTRIEDGTVLDTTEGDIFIGRSAVIAPSRIIGPTYIGSMTQVKQFSIIAESCIGKNCRIAGEIELSIVSDYTNKAHLGFLGHSYVGEWVNIGASTNTSDLKMTYGDIKVNGIDGTTKIDTGINKLGSFLGDMSKTSIGTLLFSGRRIGVSSHLYGFVTEDVPSFTIYGKGMNAENVELELESSMKTQRKMMARRNIAMTQAYEKMVKHVFELTAEERKRSSVANKKFNL